MVRVWIAAICLLLAFVPTARAHLMVDQKGTLNLVGDTAYLVLSLPVNALTDVDTNRDGLLAFSELRANWTRIQGQVRDAVTVQDADQTRYLQDIILNLASPDGQGAPASYLVVLGRFRLEQQRVLQLHVARWSNRAAEQQLAITVTKAGAVRTVLLTPANATAALWPTAMDLVQTAAGLGVTHIFAGFDHLAFLAVVVVTVVTWRQLAVLLTAFTAGHALTCWLVLSQTLVVPGAFAELLIAVTVVGLGLFEFARRGQRGTPVSPGRLMLILVCAMIHGVGLANVLADEQMTTLRDLLPLAAFNFGIEVGQLLVASAMLLAMRVLQRAFGRTPVTAFTHAVLLSAIALGGYWTVDRVAVLAGAA